MWVYIVSYSSMFPKSHAFIFLFLSSENALQHIPPHIDMLFFNTIDDAMH